MVTSCVCVFVVSVQQEDNDTARGEVCVLVRACLSWAPEKCSVCLVGYKHDMPTLAANVGRPRPSILSLGRRGDTLQGIRGSVLVVVTCVCVCV